MKKLLLMLAFVPCMGYCVCAQESPRPAIAEQELSDSLAPVYRQIDQMDLFGLKKQRESYVYKCRKEPSDANRAILAYIEKRMQEVK
jgi:hypothetical protein